MNNYDAPRPYVTQDRGNRTSPGRLHPRYWILSLLLQKLKHIVASEWLEPGERLIDYGCGNRPYESLFTTKFPRYIGADFPGNPHSQVVIGPRGELPIENESIDCVLSTQVLEHVEDPSAYLGEAYRVLRPGRALVLSTHGVWRYHPDPTDYWRWTIDGLHMELYRAGFDVWWTQSVFGMASCALQLWQDATVESVPRFLRPPFIWLLQSLIGLIERWQPDTLSWDASVYVVLAKKRGSVGAAEPNGHRSKQGGLPMKEENPPSPVSCHTEPIRAFYDHFADSRMIGYLQKPNHRIEKALARILPLVATRSAVLEVGCGIGLVAERIASVATDGFIWACDISDKNIGYARQRVQAPNVQFRRADVIGGFDELRLWISKPVQLVIMVDVLEHIPTEHHLDLFRNLRNVMDQDSTLVLSYPSPQYQRHLRENNPGELQVVDEVIELPHVMDLASQTGFSIKHFSLEDVWLTNQYVHCLLAASTALTALQDSSGLRSILKEIASLIPPGEAFILIDEAHWRTENVDGRLVLPFLERDGYCWGPPPDDATAIVELNRLRGAGAHFIVFASSALWWLDYYSGFKHYLCSSYPCIVQNDSLLAFDLREQPACDAMARPFAAPQRCDVPTPS